MRNDNYQLNLNETFVLKGVAILGIVLHNFCHWLPEVVVENQHVFCGERNYEMINLFLDGGPNLLLNIFSHYGHYGVPVFVFLSGYGLVVKYENNNTPIRFQSYMKKHIGKLWLLLLPLLIPHFLILSLRETSYFQEHLPHLVMMTGFIGNLHPDLYVFHGPWWFFSLIIQLYAIYYLFVYRNTLKPIIVLTILCLAAQIAVISIYDSPDYLKYMRYNFIGSVLPFALGIVAARKKYFPTKRMAAVFLILFVICCFNIYSWLLTFGLVTVVVLPIVKILLLNSSMYAFFKWLGTISAFLFVSHPIIRSCIFKFSEYSIYLSILAYILLSILFACIYRIILLWSKQKILSSSIVYNK